MIFPLVQSGFNAVRTNNLFVINVDEQAFSKLLLTQKPTPHSELVVTDQSGQIYADTSGQKLQLLDSTLQEKLQQSEGVPFLTTSFGDPMLAISMPSSSHLFETLNYTVFIPIRDIQAKADYIRDLSIYLTLFGLIITICLSIYMSRRKCA